jgi:Domain of unknown function (DUF4249)
MESKMMISKYFKPNYLIALFLSVSFLACEEEYIPDTNLQEQEIVVEGYVEVGSSSNPTFVILTKSIPFISTIEPDKFTELFLRGATVTVNDGDKTVILPEVCLSNLPENIKAQVYEVLGFSPDSSTVDICLYADIFQQLTKGYGRKYDLKVLIDDKEITATTTVPSFVPLDNLRWEDTPGIPSDTLAQLLVTIDDPVGVANFYRYQTATEGNGFLAPFNSVIDGEIFDGKKFDIPLQKAERRGGDFDPNSFGLYLRGDTVTVKWSTIDKAHFDFWNTRDFSANSGGPFSSYTRIASNVKGGLGVWGGYATEQYKTVVPFR